MVEISNETKFIIITAGVLVLWFSYGYLQVVDWISHNGIVAFFAIMGLYTFLIMQFVFNMSPVRHPKTFLSFFIIWLALDLIMPPYLVSATGILTEDPAVITSDVTIYHMWNQSGWMGYYLTLVVTPILLLLLASFVLPEKQFFQHLRDST